MNKEEIEILYRNWKRNNSIKINDVVRITKNLKHSTDIGRCYVEGFEYCKGKIGKVTGFKNIFETPLVGVFIETEGRTYEYWYPFNWVQKI